MNADLIEDPTIEEVPKRRSIPSLDALAEEDPELSPGREALIQELKDAHQLDKESSDEEEFKDARDTPADGDKAGKDKKKKDKYKKKDKEEREKERKEEKLKLEEEFQKLWSEPTEVDPYKGLSLDKGDGKIQVVDQHNGEGQVKYRYFIKKRPQPIGDFKKYFKSFDWKAKGVIRKRFEALRWPQLLRPGYEIKDLKEKLKDVRESLKALEEVSGKIPQLRQVLSDQQIKYNFLVKPKQYYKDFGQVLNNDPLLAKEQIDVRRLPPYYVHRKVREVLEKRMRDLKLEKERKFRTTLSDHALFGIICDSKKLNKAPERAEGEPEEVDWGKAFPEQQLEEEEKEAGIATKPAKPQRDNVYDKFGPFSNDTCLLIHRTLHSLNYEYIFFVSESGKKEIGVFIVLLEALVYK